MTVMMMTMVPAKRALLLLLPSPSHAKMMVVSMVVKQANSLLQMPAAWRVMMLVHVLMLRTKMVLPESSQCATMRATTTVKPVLLLMAKQKVLLQWRQ